MPPLSSRGTCVPLPHNGSREEDVAGSRRASGSTGLYVGGAVCLGRSSAFARRQIFGDEVGICMQVVYLRERLQRVCYPPL